MGRGLSRAAVGHVKAVPARWDDERCSLFGVRLSVVDIDSVADSVLAAARSQLPMTVSSLAVHGMMLAVRDETFRAVVNSLDLLCADGHPVRWLLNRESKAQLARRVSGTDLMDLLCARCAAHGIGVFFYGSTPEVVSTLARRLGAKYASLIACGAEPSVFRALTRQEDRTLVERINSSGAGVVFVGLGCPLQEAFAHAHEDSIKAVQVCVGAAFDFLSGNKTRAPIWVQRCGLEWLHRLIHEPRRLGRRYLATNSLFLWMTLRSILRGRSCG